MRHFALKPPVSTDMAARREGATGILGGVQRVAGLGQPALRYELYRARPEVGVPLDGIDGIPPVEAVCRVLQVGPRDGEEVFCTKSALALLEGGEEVQQCGWSHENRIREILTRCALPNSKGDGVKTQLLLEDGTGIHGRA